MELYNAINQTFLKDADKIKFNTLEQALYRNQINDLSFIINERLIVVLEHQTIPNNNMALRILMYIAFLYHQMIPNKALHLEKQIKIPTPELYVLYNGKMPQPAEQMFNLSDSFLEKREGVMPLEVVVKFININYEVGHGVLSRSAYLYEYSYFVYLVEQHRKAGKPLGEALGLATNVAKERGILTEFLQKYDAEVFNMFEWKMEDALEARYEDGIEHGIERGIERGAFEKAIEMAKAALENSLSPELISILTGLSIDVVQGLKMG